MVYLDGEIVLGTSWCCHSHQSAWGPMRRKDLMELSPLCGGQQDRCPQRRPGHMQVK